jgi:hypothetical protein
MLLLLTSKVQGLQSISFGKEGFRAVAQLQRRTAKLEREIADLIIMSMGKDAFDNLTKVASGNFGRYEIKEHEGLHTELYYLRNLGFVKLRDDVKESVGNSIHRLPREEGQLSKYIEVTPIGRKYIALRETWLAARDSDGQDTH